jgi:hypothetical protein
MDLSTLQGAVTGINTSLRTITLNDVTVKVPSNTTITIDGASATLDQAAAKFALNISSGAGLSVSADSNPDIRYLSDGWTLVAGTLTFTTKKLEEADFAGAITGVDTAAGTVTINGQVILIEPSTTVSVDDIVMSSSEFIQASGAALAKGAIITIDSSTLRYQYMPGYTGWVFKGSQATFSTNLAAINNFNGALSGVDTENGTITVNGSKIAVQYDPSGFTLDGVSITLDALRVKLASVGLINGIIWLSGARVNYSASKAIVADCRIQPSGVTYAFTTRNVGQSGFAGLVTDFSGGIITVNGLSVKLPSSFTMTVDGSTTNSLAAAITAANTNGRQVWMNPASITYVESAGQGQWTFAQNSSLTFTTGTGVLTLGSAALASIPSSQPQGYRLINVGGKTIKITSATTFGSGITPDSFTYSQPIGIQEFPAQRYDRVYTLGRQVAGKIDKRCRDR